MAKQKQKYRMGVYYQCNCPRCGMTEAAFTGNYKKIPQFADGVCNNPEGVKPC